MLFCMGIEMHNHMVPIPLGLQPQRFLKVTMCFYAVLNLLKRMVEQLELSIWRAA